MSEEKENVASAQATKRKRGISNQTQAVAQLKFHEKDAAQNGLFVGHLEEVKVDWSVNADGKEFTGLKIPRFTIHFTSNHSNASEKRHVYQTLFPIPSNVNTIPGGSEEWKVNNVFNWIKHILDVFYLKGREFTVEEENALSLSFEDYKENEDGSVEYIPLEPEAIVAGYRVMFENACAMLNGKFNLKEGEVAKPCYKTADGKFISCWIKLLRHKKRKNEWINVTSNGDLGFDSFIGNGVVELMKKDVPPTVLRIDFAKESITPKEVKKAPTIGGAGMNGMMAMGGVNAGYADAMGTYNPSNDASMAAADDMPFE